MTDAIETNETVDIGPDVAVATLVGKALRQRLGSDDMVADDNGVLFVDEVSDGAYWLQGVQVDDTYRTEPIITDHLGRRYRVLVEQV